MKLKIPDHEHVSSRTVHASREPVYRACTRPGQLKNWCGPADFTSSFQEFDLRPGGKWNFIMHGPDKGSYVNACEFIQIEPLSLLSWKRYSKPLLEVVATFEELAPERTKVLFGQIFPSEEGCRKIRNLAGEKNEELFDRLECELRMMTG